MMRIAWIGYAKYNFRGKEKYLRTVCCKRWLDWVQSDKVNIIGYKVIAIGSEIDI